MRVARLPGIALIGAVRGPVKEGEEVLGELRKSNPFKVVLDVSPEELKGLTEHFTTPNFEPLALLLDTETTLAEELASFGEVRMPSPAFITAIRWAKENGRELVALDPDEESYTDMYLKHMGYLDLVHLARAEHKLKRSPPKAESPEQLVTYWDEKLHADKGSRKIALERRRLSAERLKELVAENGAAMIAAVVDVEHMDLILHLLKEES